LIQNTNYYLIKLYILKNYKLRFFMW